MARARGTRKMKLILKKVGGSALVTVLGYRRARHIGRWVNVLSNGDGLGSDWHSNGEGMVFEAIVKVSDTFRNGVIFEVGANDGRHTVAMLNAIERLAPKASLRIHSFEPSFANFSRLCSAVRSSGLENLVRLNQAGCSDHPRIGALECWDNAGGGVNTLHERIKKPETDTHLEDVALVSLDNYAKEAGVDQVLFLKIDTEGHDFAVLQGASELLRNKAVRYLQFEYNSTWIPARRYLRDVFDFLRPLGYSLGKIHRDFIEEFVHWDYRLEWFEETNYLAWLEGSPLPTKRNVTESYLAHS